MPQSHSAWHGSKLLGGLVCLVALLLSVFLGFKTYQTWRTTQEVGRAQPYEHSINVEGTAKIRVAPNIASFTFGLDNRAPNLTDAQKKNTDGMNVLIEKFKALGIAAEDLQTTNYNAYQEMNWDQNKQLNVPGNWIVSQQLMVTIRDIAKAATVVATAGQGGSTNIYGPNFATSDEVINSMKDKARADALADAQKRAGEIAKSLGVHLNRAIGYGEWFDGNPMPYYAEGKGGMGGGGGPSVQPGMQEQTLHVNVTYSLEE